MRALRAAVGRARGGVSAAWDAVLHLSDPIFIAVIAAALGCAGFLVAAGAHDLADLRDRRHETRGNSQASSPVPYGTTLLPVLNQDPGEATALKRDFRVILRIDSLAAGAGVVAPCDLMASLQRWSAGRAGVSVSYLALTDTDVPCAEHLSQHQITVTPASPNRTEAAVSWQEARWAVIDPSGRSLYSRADLPSLLDVERVFGVLHAGRFTVDGKASDP